MRAGDQPEHLGGGGEQLGFAARPVSTAVSK
jgi:hypothetical protein